MNLGEIRTLFIERSGREDLINLDDSDNGANFFIQSGQRTLDRMFEVEKSWARSFKDFPAGSYYAIFKGCRAIKRVWITSATERVKLEKATLEELRELYTGPPDDVDQGDSLYYCPISLRTYPDDSNIIIDYFYGSKIEDVATEDYEYLGILVLPPPDVASHLEVFGLFSSPELSADGDESYWTVKNPEILLMASLYHLEVNYRNTEGANDWMGAIKLELINLEKDLVESEIAEVTQISG